MFNKLRDFLKALTDLYPEYNKCRHNFTINESGELVLTLSTSKGFQPIFFDSNDLLKSRSDVLDEIKTIFEAQQVSMLIFLDEKIPNTYSLRVSHPVLFEELYRELKTLKILGYWTTFCGRVLIFRSVKFTPDTKDLIRDLLGSITLSIEFIEDEVKKC